MRLENDKNKDTTGISDLQTSSIDRDNGVCKVNDMFAVTPDTLTLLIEKCKVTRSSYGGEKLDHTAT